MNTPSGQRPQFSIMTALLLTLIIALLLGLVFNLGEYRKLERDYVALDVEYHRFQQDTGKQIKRLQNQFGALHAAPIVGVHLRGSEYRPLLFKIATTLDKGNDLDSMIGNGKDAFLLSKESKVNGQKYWGFGGHVQRVGSIGDADCYQLILHPTMNLQLRINDQNRMITKTNGKEQTVFVQYDGSSKVFYSDPTLVIAIGPTKQAVVEEYKKYYPKSFHNTLEKNWNEPALVVKESKVR